MRLGARLRAGQAHLLTGRSCRAARRSVASRSARSAGNHFAAAELYGPNVANAWVQWRFPFKPRTAGAYELQARAPDLRRQMQPATIPFNDGGYLFRAVVKYPVQVRA